MITLTRTPDQWIKINIDGSTINNPGKIGVGGIMRDQQGKLLMVVTTPLGKGSNNKAKIKATIFGFTL